MNIQLQKQSIFFLFLISILLLWTRVESIRFDIESGQSKCIAEDVTSSSMTLGKYTIIKPNEGHVLPDTHKITVRVQSTYENVLYHSSDNVTEGQFAFETGEAGDYVACFFVAEHNPPVSFTVDFDWKFGFAAKNLVNVATKGSVESMELELKSMFGTVQSIHDEMFYLRKREQEMQQLNASTNSKMGWFSLLSILISLSVAGVQFWYLKFFFQKKKII
ncbi:Transmembrane emp24 domain-containing protein p24delta10 [Striga hermonthica]|uniref:Transmembrane emp24 domain-containing protein p24delta10 n=1 Tax=Striga hermonthica TaxID=68872 RepID=A0A9N7N7E4_STRHE|nr:Transmembrane emp24 domain-containing protein p24delta10 [Striga hermonthica]